MLITWKEPTRQGLHFLFSPSKNIPGAHGTHSVSRTTWPTGQVKSAVMESVAGSGTVVGSDSRTSKSSCTKKIMGSAKVKNK